MVKIKKNYPEVAIIMGSQSDWNLLKKTALVLKSLKIKYSYDIISAHRTPQRLYDFASNAHLNNIKVIIAGAGGAAHLPGMVASLTHLPVLGVPVESKALKGLDSLLSIAQMPFGIPVASLAIGESGAKNSALLAASILSLQDKALEKRLISWRNKQTKLVAKKPI